MISYPGEILKRFGRYEAVEDSGRSGRAHLWRAWDPFLERFVLIVALPGLDPGEMHRAMRNVDAALARWTDGKYQSSAQVLDFSPGDDDEAPFFVLTPTEGSAAAEMEEDLPTPTRHAPPRAKVLDAARQRSGLLSMVGVCLLLAGIGSWYVTRPSPVHPPAAIRELGSPESGMRPEQRQEHAAQRLVERGSGGGEDSHAGATPSGEVEASHESAAASEEQPAQPAGATPLERHAREETGSKPAPPEMRFEPPPGSVRLTSGESRDFTVKSGSAAGLRYSWQLNGRIVEQDAIRYRLPSDLKAGGRQTLTVTVSDWSGKTVASAQWTVEVEARNRAPLLSLSTPAREVAVGDRVTVKAQIQSQEVTVGGQAERADRFECEWAVNGEPKQRFCDEFEWQVPQETSPGPVKIALTVRERRGLATTQELTVTVRQPPVAPAGAEAAAAPPSPGAAAGAAERGQPEVPPVRALDDRTAAQQAIDAYFKRYESEVRAQRGQEASVHFQVDRLELLGEHGNATCVRTVELPGQPPQSVNRTLDLRKQNGVWTVEERK